jgi:hypothetical protein
MGLQGTGAGHQIAPVVLNLQPLPVIGPAAVSFNQPTEK